MANITMTHTPNEFEMAYGKVIVSLYDLDESGGIRMAVQVTDTNDVVIGEVRQLPNPSGYCHFDISNILKAHVTSRTDLETITKLATGENEVFQYKLNYGYVPFNGTFVNQGVVSGKYALNGRKSYTEVDWDSSQYKFTISEQPLGPTTYNRVDFPQKALTDRPFTETTGAAITDGKPIWVSSTTPVNITDYLRGTDYTISFLNDWIANPTVGDWTNGINSIRLAIYNGSTALLNTDLVNLVSNGGGPNINYNDEIAPTGEYRLITAQIGALSDTLSPYFASATHFYVSSGSLTRDPAEVTAYGSVSEVYRFNINDGECNDFDNIEVSWLNSFGVRDYFNFQKRSDYETNVTRNTYKQLDADWASDEIVVNPYNRGERVFSQEVSETYTANTKYLSDAESEYLKNLFISPDTRVKIDGVWRPAILTSNTWTEKTYRKDKLFQHTIQFRLANPIETQRG